MSEPFRVLVTGSRATSAWQDAHVRAVLRRVCADALGHGRRVIVVQGECPYGGVDLTAKLWAQETPGVESEGHPADWERLGRAAGTARNSHMVSIGADVCLAFPAPASRGTWDCLKKAARAGIFGRVYPLVTTSAHRGGDA